MSETYILTASGAAIRGSDGACIPVDVRNRDYAAFQAWVTAGGVATPYAAPAIVYSCQLWQLQAVMTPTEWGQVQTAIAALGNPAISAFFAHGTNSIPSNSTTLLSLGEALGLTTDQIVALVQAASAVVIP